MWRRKIPQGEDKRALTLTVSRQVKQAFRITCIERSVVASDAITLLLIKASEHPEIYIDPYTSSDRYIKRKLLMYAQGMPSNITVKIGYELMTKLRDLCRERRLALCHVGALLIQDFVSNPNIIDLSSIVQERFIPKEDLL